MVRFRVGNKLEASKIDIWLIQQREIRIYSDIRGKSTVFLDLTNKNAFQFLVEQSNIQDKYKNGLKRSISD